MNVVSPDVWPPMLGAALGVGGIIWKLYESGKHGLAETLGEENAALKSRLEECRSERRKLIVDNEMMAGQLARWKAEHGTSQ